MKPSSFLTAAVTAVLILFSSSFSSGNGASSPNVPPDAAALKQNTHYYWYLASGDVYDGWRTVTDEITSLETRYGVSVDTDPRGGTLLARGYTLFGTPHLVWPSAYLYGH